MQDTFTTVKSKLGCMRPTDWTQLV